MKLKPWLVSLAILPALAIAEAPLTAESTHADVEKNLRNVMKMIAPKMDVGSVTESPIKGLYEVVAGPLVIYMSADGQYLVQGKMMNLATGQDLTERAKAEYEVSRRDFNVDQIKAVSEKTMIVYEPENPQYTVNVFTDIDCGYCRKLHSDMDGYLKNGIRIRYLSFPRAGLGSSSFDKARNVWCADDQKLAMTDAKAGKTIPTIECDAPIADHLSLGGRLNVNGTPALFLEDGESLPGYIPPDKLKAYLDQKKAQKKS